MTRLTHADADGAARMVDVSEKAVTRREARASGRLRCSAETLAQILSASTPKGNPLETARLAGIMAAKRTDRLIPLCHPLLLEHIDVTIQLEDDGIRIGSVVVTTGKTGAEMEALTAVSVAALSLYDMLKAVDKRMIIGEIRLDYKTGGKSGTYERRDDG